MLLDKLKQWTSLFVFTPTILGPACIVSRISPSLSYRLMQKWAEAMRKSAKLQVNMIDLNKPSTLTTIKNKTGTLYVHLNQQTLLSMVLYLAVLPFHKTVMNIEFALIPFIGWCPTLFGGVPIVRQLPSLAKRSLEKVVEDLKAGDKYCISIEGKRCGSDGKLSPYKKGPVVLALESQCDIVPFLTFGEFLAWPYGEWSLLPEARLTSCCYQEFPPRVCHMKKIVIS